MPDQDKISDPAPSSTKEENNTKLSTDSHLSSSSNTAAQGADTAQPPVGNSGQLQTVASATSEPLKDNIEKRDVVIPRNTNQQTNAPAIYVIRQAYASIFQSIIVGISLLVGGIWAAYNFSTLSIKRKADIDLKTAELAYDKASLERETASLHLLKTQHELRPTVLIDLSAMQLTTSFDKSNNDMQYLSVDILFSNTGKGDIVLDVSSGADFDFYVAKVTTVDDHGIVNLGPQKKLKLLYGYQEIQSISLLGGGDTMKFSALQLVEPGVYLLRFQAGNYGASKFFTVKTAETK